MREWLVGLFGKDVYSQVVIAMSGLLEQLIGCLLFNLNLKRRKHFGLALVLLVLLLLPLGIGLAYLRYALSSVLILRGILHALTLASYLALLVTFLYQGTGFRKTLTFCATNATIVLVGKLFSLLLNVFGIDDKTSMSFFGGASIALDWGVYYAFHIVMYVLFGRIFREKEDLAETKRTQVNILLLTILSVILTDFVFGFSDPYQNQSWTLTILLKVLDSFICLFVLLIRHGIFFQSQKEQEAQVMAELFHEEKNQFDSVRANVDIINAKCHDLRHQLNDLGSKITDEELSKLKDATRIYDSTVKTGNDVLDAIIYEKQLLCEKNQIRFTTLADGSAVRFFDSTELYALLNNAIGNAVDACLAIPEPEKRLIDLAIYRKKGLVFVEVTNSCQGEVRFDEKGLPLSDKTGDHPHGYGSRSIRYLTEKYQGTMTCSAKNNVYRLLLVFEDKETTETARS
jgi:hypothetical protein